MAEIDLSENNERGCPMTPAHGRQAAKRVVAARRGLRQTQRWRQVFEETVNAEIEQNKNEGIVML